MTKKMAVLALLVGMVAGSFAVALGDFMQPSGRSGLMAMALGSGLWAFIIPIIILAGAVWVYVCRVDEVGNVSFPKASPKWWLVLILFGGMFVAAAFMTFLLMAMVYFGAAFMGGVGSFIGSVTGWPEWVSKAAFIVVFLAVVWLLDWVDGLLKMT